MTDKLSHYRILRKLASGGMGDVHLAEDEILGRRVAIKVLPGEVANDPERLARFRREARAVSALNHPNILTIHEYGEEAGRHFFVTEYINGSTLRELLTRDPTIEERLAVAAGVASALSAAHGASVVHRDIKPDNIMITEAGAVKVLDFGLAKVIRGKPDEEISTGAGRIVGTVPYMAPEQIRSQEMDGGADVFSLGVTLFEMFEGRRPFDGVTAHDIIATILTRDPPSPSQSKQISPALARLISSMLAKDSSDRPTSMQVVRELDQIRASLHRVTSLEKTVTREIAASPESTPSNLPAEVTSLIGRDREVDAIRRLLRLDDVRLVTITGAGGSGKSRLALRVAAQMQSDFAGGIWFVPLESVESAAMVPSAIAQTIGIRETAGQRPVTTVAERLRGHRVLLVIDNLEHVIDCAPALASLLDSASGLKILGTSQIPLHIRAEHEYPLEPLEVPPPDARVANVRLNPAVALFVERARHVRPEFELTDDNAEAVAEICRLVDGLPLAIELAAVRVKLLTPSALLHRLRDPIAFLVGGPRDLPLRQQTLRRTVEWSVQLLSDSERRLFEQMAIFSGGATLDAVSQICEVDEETVASLLDKSLLRREASQNPERVTMLGPVRVVAAETLASSGDRSALADRHLKFFAALGEEIESILTGPGQPIALRRLDAEQNNIRAALTWSLTANQIADGLRLASTVWRFWEIRGLWREGRDMIDRLLRASAHVNTQLRRRGLYAAGVLADAEGDFGGSREYFEAMLQLCRVTGDAWGVADALNNVAIAALRVGAIADAEAMHNESLRLWRELDNHAAVALSLHNLANIERARGYMDKARSHYEESRESFRRIGDERGVALSLQRLGDIDRESGHLDSAAALYDESLRLFMRLSDHWNVANCMSDFGRLMHVKGDLHQAHELLEESLLIFREVGDRRSGATVLESLALLALDERQQERAEKLAGAVSAVRESLGAEQSSNPAILDLRTAASANWRAGERLSFDEAVEFAQTLPAV
ncbi:MAG TPA: protein kinase [Thermoanaerobaculia bacterium]|nr:protein kinase [Thermoanaerobaculia bacterium]